MPVSGELPFPDQLDVQGRCLLCAGVARAVAADRHSLHGAARANGFHRSGGPRSRRRSGRLRPLPRGSLPRRGRGDRGRRNPVGGDRSRRLMDLTSRRKSMMTGVLRFHGEVAGRRGRSAEAVRGSGAADRQHREHVRVHAAIQGPRGAASEARPARLFGARISVQPVRRPGAGRRRGRSSSSVRAIMPSPFRCSPRSTSMAATSIRCLPI